jgi:triphosphoribosyl-dephospho-CoA synthetase
MIVVEPAITPAPMKNWLAAACVLGAIASGATRQHMTAALAAMTAAVAPALNLRGRLEWLKVWDAENKLAIETNRKANEQYVSALKQKESVEQKIREIQLTAAQYDDRAAMQLAQTRQLDVLRRLIEQRTQHAQQLDQLLAAALAGNPPSFSVH